MHQASGKDIGFWAAGMAVYGVCIFCSELLACRKLQHAHSGRRDLPIVGVHCVLFLLWHIEPGISRGDQPLVCANVPHCSPLRNNLLEPYADVAL